MEDEKYIEENYDTFSLNVSNYKTKLTRKYLNRKKWVEKNPGIIKAFIPGTITSIQVKADQHVKEGDMLVTFEAMKMDNQISSPMDGKVTQISVKEGDLVTKETVLMVIEPEE